MKGIRGVFCVLVGLALLIGCAYLERKRVDIDYESGRVYSVVDKEGTTRHIEWGISVKDMTSECHEVSDFFVVVNYVSFSNIPKGGCDILWEIPEGAELVYIESTVGSLDWVSSDYGAVISLDGDSDIQMLVYLKTYDLESTLTGIVGANKGIDVATFFEYEVRLPDGGLVRFDKYSDDTKQITLGDYFNIAEISK